MSEQWRTTTLGESCIMYQPKTITRKEMSIDGEYPVYGANGVIGYYSEFNHEDSQLIIGCRGSVGAVHITESKSWINGNAMVIQSKKEDISQAFLRYLFLGGIDISNSISGSAQPQITRRSLAPVEFSYPINMEEQQRIVSILDQVYRDVEFRIEKNNEKLENAREMSQNILNSAFENNDWNFAILEEILSVQPRNGWSPPAVFHSDSGTPVLTLSSVTGNVFKADQYKFTSAPVDPQRHYWVENGDLLITRSNTPKLVGHVAIASGINIPTIYSDLIMRMNPDSEKVLTKFLYYQMQSKLLREEIMGRAKGANPTMVKINKKSLQSIPIYFPSLEKQEIIINFIEQLFQHIRELEAVFHEEASALSEFKQSILQEAFNGNL